MMAGVVHILLLLLFIAITHCKYTNKLNPPSFDNIFLLLTAMNPISSMLSLFAIRKIRQCQYNRSNRHACEYFAESTHGLWL